MHIYLKSPPIIYLLPYLELAVLEIHFAMQFHVLLLQSSFNPIFLIRLVPYVLNFLRYFCLKFFACILNWTNSVQQTYGLWIMNLSSSPSMCLLYIAAWSPIFQYLQHVFVLFTFSAFVLLLVAEFSLVSLLLVICLLAKDQALRGLLYAVLFYATSSPIF